MKYNRILLKVSGEQLAGRFEGGIDAELGAWLAEQIKQVEAAGIQIVIMVGGGNFARGAQLAGHGIKRVTADYIGMLGTMMNALALNDIFESHELRSRCLSNVFAEQVAEPFVHRLAEEHLANGRVIIVAGGIGRPYLTTDTAAVSLALELSCDVVLKATKVDGVFDKDPEINADAVKYDQLSANDAVSNPSIKVMDKAAMGLAFEHNLPIIVFNLLKPGNILLAATGKKAGTIIKT
jgi:uridylate kinase